MNTTFSRQIEFGNKKRELCLIVNCNNFVNFYTNLSSRRPKYLCFRKKNCVSIDKVVRKYLNLDHDQETKHVDCSSLFLVSTANLCGEILPRGCNSFGAIKL